MEEEDEEEDNMDGKEERKSLKQSLDTLQNTLLEFQEGCGLVASYLERISNMAHFEEVWILMKKIYISDISRLSWPASSASFLFSPPWFLALLDSGVRN